MIQRALTYGLVLGLFVVAARPAGAAGACCPDVTTPTGQPNEILQEFEYLGGTHTHWRVRYAHRPGKGLYITGAWFRNDRGVEYKVLEELSVASILAVFNTGAPRLHIDMFRYPLIHSNLADTSCCGEILDHVVVKEVMPRGMVWKDDQEIVRGHQMVLRSTMDAANFNYIFKYTFRDDGIIKFALGVTGRRLPGYETVPVVHNVLWRIDTDIAGGDNDRVRLVRHLASIGAQGATDEANTVATEQSFEWLADEFTTIRVEDTIEENPRNRAISWDLMPPRYGNSRLGERFTHADAWVTRYRAGEEYGVRVPTYDDDENVDDTDVVLWLATPIQHVPRDEDGYFDGSRWVGVVHTMWGWAQLKPRNVFDRTPFFPY